MKKCVIQCRRVLAAPPCDENYSLMAKIVIVAQTARALQVQREAMPVRKSHLSREETALKVLREKLYRLSFPPLRPVVCQLRRLLRVSSLRVPSSTDASGIVALAASTVLSSVIGPLLLASSPPQFLLLLHMQHAHLLAQLRGTSRAV